PQWTPGRASRTPRSRWAAPRRCWLTWGPRRAGRPPGLRRGPWPRMGFAERGALLHRFADLIEANGDALALGDTTDMGKPISDARSRDVPRAAANYRFFAAHARLSTGEWLPMDT